MLLRQHLGERKLTTPDSEMCQAIEALCNDDALGVSPGAYLAIRIKKVLASDEPLVEASRYLGKSLAVATRSLSHFIRLICSRELAQAFDYPFFYTDYRDGEDADAALVRLFQAERPHHANDFDTVLAMCHG